MALLSAKDKGKARASEDFEESTYYDPPSAVGGEDSRSTLDYETALESALYDVSDSSTNRHHGTNGSNIQEPDEDEEFIYNGKDDEDMRVFQEDARLESLDYKERLRSVLGDAAEVEEPGGLDDVGEPPTPRPSSNARANGPSMSTPPRSPTRSPSSLTRSPSTIRRRSSMNSPPDLPSPSLSARQQPLPPSQPFPRPKARPPSLSSPSSSTHSSSLLQDSSQILASPSSSRFGYLPPRRPPMNPLVSRLRSTSATPSPSFRGIRSVSQTSSLASLAFNDADELHGFANGSFILGADESFASTNRNGKYPASVSESRRSSSSNLRDIDRGGVRMTPTASSDAQREGDVTNTTLYPPARRKDLAAPPDDIHRLVPPIKWTVLKRLSQRLFSHPSTHGKGSAVVSDPGMPTCFAVSGGLIVVGMSRGWTMIYDYSQSLKAIIGSDEVAKACGKVTSVAISQDTTFIAVAYFSAHIHLYEWAKKPALPARTVTPTTLQAVNAGKAEGHLARDASGRGSEIHHLGFVGRRHTAIVSGDQYGLAFYHSLGKVLGLANTDILRILGKYPLDLASLGTKSANGDISPHSHHPRLLGAQALPLGTEVHFTDDYNLIALLTAGKMVVAGLKPSPRTWWRYVNESGFSGHSKTMSSAGASSTTSDVDEDVPPRRQAKSEAVDGCLAWLPSIDASPPLLAWSWGAEVRIARIEKGRTVEAVGTGKMGNKQSNTLARPARNGVKEPSQAEPAFRLLSKQRTSSKNTRETSSGQLEPVHSGDETIQAMQWLNRHLLALVTAAKVQVLDMTSLEVIEECSNFGAAFVVPKDRSIQQSVKAYKGKLFYLTAHDLRVGSVLSWADRVLHLVSTGQLVQAIELLVLYHGAKTARQQEQDTVLPFSTLELPQDQEGRAAAVEPRLRDILRASADYAFSENRIKNEAAMSARGQGAGEDRIELFENLVDATIRASLATNSYDFLFDDLAERYLENGIEAIFFERLEPFILSGEIKKVPVAISQQIISMRADRGQLRQAEDLIWHLDPACLDVNQAVSLCSKYKLYDALIYIYTQALRDFVGPFVELLDLVGSVLRNRLSRPPRIGESMENSITPVQSMEDSETSVPAAYTIFSYLADSLLGLSHPDQQPLDDTLALVAKRDLYDFLFSSSLKVYPPDSRQTIHTVDEDALSTPYLRLLLRFDTEATLDCLDMAMEDPYLDEEAAASGTPDRQAIVETLLTILRTPSKGTESLSTGDRTFVNIFIARNLPKYSQFVKLPSPVLQDILRQLATDCDLSTQQDRELAVEYLLSAYTPTYDNETLAMLEKAEFYRLLASIYKSRKAWPRLTSVYLRDPEQGSEIFSSLTKVVKQCAESDQAQLPLVKAEIISNAPQLVVSGISELGNMIDALMPEEHSNVLQALQESPMRQMAYLRCLLEPELDEESMQSLRSPSKHVTNADRYMYVALLSQYDPASVMRYVEKDPHLDEREIVQICKDEGNFEAVIWIQASSGEMKQCLETAHTALQSGSELIIGSLLSPATSSPSQETLHQLVSVGRAIMQVAGKACRGEISIGGMSVQSLWYDVLSYLIDTVRDMHRSWESAGLPAPDGDYDEVLSQVKQLIPEAISILISSTSSETLALPHLVRRLMEGSANSTYSEYKDILDGMLNTYRFEGNVLSTSKRLLEGDVHEQVAELIKARGSGWRPDISGICEACGRSVFMRVDERDRLSNPQLVVRSASEMEVAQKLKLRPTVRRRPSLKGKETGWYEEEAPKTDGNGPGSRSLVVFRGGAICHASCLQQDDRHR